MKKLSQRLSLTLVALLFGFMVILQFQTVKHPKQQDSKDLKQLQTDLAKAQQKHIKLNYQLSQSQQLLNKYQTSQKSSQLQTMKDALAQQKVQAGLTKKSGQGDLIIVKPLIGGNDPFSEGTVSATLIRELLNVLNEYGATDVAVGGERIVNITPIRMVHTDLLINDQKMPGLPFSIQVLSQDPANFKDQLDRSSVLDDFARKGLTLDVQIKDNLTLPAYLSSITFNNLKPAKGGS